MEFAFCSRWGSQRWGPAVRGFILTVLLSLGIQPSSGANFTIVVVPMSPIQGDKVSLDVAYGGSIQKVTWYKGSQRPENVIMTYQPSRGMSSPGPLFTGRQKVFPSGSLGISNTMKNDTGTYFVVLTLIDGEVQSQVYLYVRDESDSPITRMPAQGSTALGSSTTREPAPGSTEGSTPMILPIWASVVIAIVAFIVVASVIMGVLLYKKHKNSKRTPKGLSAVNGLSNQPSSYYENENIQKWPLPAIINSSTEYPSTYMDLKYSTSSIYEELQ